MKSNTINVSGLGADTSPVPKHHRVYLLLRQQIDAGAYGPDTPLPAEMTLAERHGVSRITVRKAMERLVQERRVVRVRGRGTFALDKRWDSPVAASLSGNIENLIALGLETDVHVLGLTYAEAPSEICADLNIAAGTTMQHSVRVRSLTKRPFSHLTTWLPEEIGRTFDAPDLGRTPLLHLIERAGHRIERAEQTISAVLAEPDIAVALDLEPGSALLQITRVVYDAEDCAVEWIRGLYRPDTYEHRSRFARSERPADHVWNI